MLFHGPLSRTSSAVTSEVNASAGALSYESPVEPPEATAPASQPLGVSHRDVSHALVRVVDQPADVAAGPAAGPDAHLQRVEGEVGARRAGQLPADHPPGEHVDDEGGTPSRRGSGSR